MSGGTGGGTGMSTPLTIEQRQEIKDESLTSAKECPRCGSRFTTVHTIMGHPPAENECFVSCIDCGLRGPHSNNDAEAAAAWNVRKEAGLE